MQHFPHRSESNLPRAARHASYRTSGMKQVLDNTYRLRKSQSQLIQSDGPIAVDIDFLKYEKKSLS
jgi:hypothetical protein